MFHFEYPKGIYLWWNLLKWPDDFRLKIFSHSPTMNGLSERKGTKSDDVWSAAHVTQDLSKHFPKWICIEINIHVYII